MRTIGKLVLGLFVMFLVFFMIFRLSLPITYWVVRTQMSSSHTPDTVDFVFGWVITFCAVFVVIGLLRAAEGIGEEVIQWARNIGRNW